MMAFFAGKSKQVREPTYGRSVRQSPRYTRLDLPALHPAIREENPLRAAGWLFQRSGRASPEHRDRCRRREALLLSRAAPEKLSEHRVDDGRRCDRRAT